MFLDSKGDFFIKKSPLLFLVIRISIYLIVSNKNSSPEDLAISSYFCLDKSKLENQFSPGIVKKI